MKPSRSLTAMAALGLLAIATTASRAADPKPLRVLLVTGGCCHDYTRQKEIIAKGMAERAHVEVTAIQQGGTTTNTKIPLYENADWSKGYDVVIHDECFSDAKDVNWTARILAPHKAGLPGVVVHCAMHCYRDGTDEWFKFCGVTSHRHGAGYPHEVLNVDADHPIMKGFGPAWANPAGELYWISKVWPTAHPLATSKNREKGNDEVCVWTNQYEKARVFGTTLGHHNETVGSPEFLDLLTRGTLWAANKLDDTYLKPKVAKVVPANLAAGRPVLASSVQAGNEAKNAVDGRPDTRWCAADASAPQWLRVDLGKPTTVKATRIDWESDGAAYRYKLEASDNEKNWRTLADASSNTKIGPSEDSFAPTSARYVRITFLGSSGGWGSVRDLAVFGDATTVVQPAASPTADDAKRLAGVKVPDGFETTLFAAPPAVSYPVFVSAAPDGTIYVSSDRNGSLDREKNRGSVVRLRDLDGDGRADEAKRFVANVDSPRGLVVDGDRVYLMHPPHLSAFIDHDGDGVADEQKVLVKNIAFDFKDRPADHTSNGVTLGIDGWLYLAIGDFGFLKAEGTDGRTLQLRGGGVVRVRPDGTGLELYSRGTRNILEVSVDPLLNGFARDNTNDGGGWDIRLHHFSGLENHGYPTLFKNFNDEVIAPLADYGGGSGCGGLYLDEPGFPRGYGDALYTADWGRDRVYRHPLTTSGATFKAGQEEFLTVPRVTDLDADASGHLYVTSWKGATFTFAGEDVGYVLRVSPKGNTPATLPDFARLDRAGLVREIASPSHRRRLEAQRVLLKQGLDDASTTALRSLAADSGTPIDVRVAALFTIKQGLGAKANAILAALATDADLREFALRALTDRLDQLQGVPAGAIAEGLHDGRPRVRRQAAASLARLVVKDPATLNTLATLLNDADPVVAHTAINALAELRASAPAFAIVDDPKATAQARRGALRVLQAIHEPAVVEGLARRLGTEAGPARRLGLIGALARLGNRDGFWRGDSWGTRPDTSGPYYQPEAWDETPRIKAALRGALDRATGAEFAGLLAEIDRNKVDLAADDAILARASADPSLAPASVAHLARAKSIPPAAVPVLVRVTTGKDTPAGRADATIALLHADGDAPLHAALASLARLESEGRDSPAFRTARDAFLAGPRSPSRRQMLDDLAAKRDGSASTWAEAALLAIDGERPKGSAQTKAKAAQAADVAWSDRGRRLQLLRAVAIAEHRPSSRRVLDALKDADPAIASAAREAAAVLNLEIPGEGPRPTGPKVGSMTVEAAIAAAVKSEGDAKMGERVFNRLNCMNCHTIRATDPPRGPFLGTIATTYKRPELAEAILLPSKTLAQGFATNVFELDDGRTVTGFVVKEAANGVTLRDGEGKEVQLAPDRIVDRVKSAVSVMPEGQVKDLTIGEFASLIAYLESLAKNQPVH